MKNLFQLFSSISLNSVFFTFMYSLFATPTFAVEMNEKIPEIRYVLTYYPYYKKIHTNRVVSYLLPRKIDGDFGGPFDLRSGVFKIASDIDMGKHSGINESTGEEFLYEDHIATLIMAPDAQGRVIPARGIGSGDTTIMTDSMGRMIAINLREKFKKTYVIGHWLTQPTFEFSRFTPTLCQPREMPTEENMASREYRYAAADAPKTDPERYTNGTFGCREWAYQLYDTKRPYIDVTSYLRSPRIFGFIGWAREGDRKPVIGLNDPNWMCLYDCPHGEKPGVIPDILTWAKKNGWEPPQRPARMPIFPDPIR